MRKTEWNELLGAQQTQYSEVSRNDLCNGQKGGLYYDRMI